MAKKKARENYMIIAWVAVIAVIVAGLIFFFVNQGTDRQNNLPYHGKQVNIGDKAYIDCGTEISERAKDIKTTEEVNVIYNDTIKCLDENIKMCNPTFVQINITSDGYFRSAVDGWENNSCVFAFDAVALNISNKIINLREECEIDRENLSYVYSIPGFTLGRGLLFYFAIDGGEFVKGVPGNVTTLGLYKDQNQKIYAKCTWMKI